MAKGLNGLATANETIPDLAQQLAEILEGLLAAQKHLSPKWFYDERGSELFDRICTLPEYYPTRTELSIMSEHLDEVAKLVGPRAAVIEFGAGSNLKVRQLLDALDEPAAYVPVEISADYLLKQAEDLARDYPNVHIQPVFADFTKPFELPAHPITPDRNLVFFPGSTIGNFTPPEARRFLARLAQVAGPGGGILIGADLRKDPALLEAAYDDAQGVTAAFDRNLLVRINRELGADFPLERFRHRSVWNGAEGRVEMHLVALDACVVTVAGRRFAFAAGETIHTENAYKYTLEGFAALAAGAGLAVRRVWTDPRGWFSVQWLTPRDGPA